MARWENIGELIWWNGSVSFNVKLAKTNPYNILINPELREFIYGRINKPNILCSSMCRFIRQGIKVDEKRK